MHVTEGQPTGCNVWHVHDSEGHRIAVVDGPRELAELLASAPRLRDVLRDAQRVLRECVPDDGICRTIDGLLAKLD